MSLSSDEVNFLIYRYLLEAGFTHSAFVFGCESSVNRTNTNGKDVPLGALLMFIQKGFQFMELEANLNEEGTDVYAEFTPLSARDILTKDVSELRASVKELRERQAENGGAVAGPSNDAMNGHEAKDLSTRQLSGHSGEVHCLAYSPAAGLLASAAADGWVRTWNLDNGLSVICSSGSGASSGTSQPVCLDWSPDGLSLATGTQQGDIIIWNRDGSHQATFPSESRCSILAVKWNKKGDSLLVADADGSLFVWDVKQSSLKQQWNSGHGAIFDVDWRNAVVVAAGHSDGTAAVYKLGNDSPLKTCSCTDPDIPSWVLPDINALQWDPTGRLLAVACGSPAVWLVQGQGDAAPRKLLGHKREVLALSWGGKDREGRIMLATGSADGSIRVWLESGACTAVLDRHLDGITKVAWHSDGVYLASGDGEGNVTVWNTRDKRSVKTTKGPSGVADLSWTGDSLAVAFIGSPTLLIAELK